MEKTRFTSLTEIVIYFRLPEEKRIVYLASLKPSF